MPRVENLGPNVDDWYENEGGGNGSSTHDVCLSCWSDLQVDSHEYDAELTPYNGDPQGDDGWGGEVVHPPYAEEDYTCEVCGDVLGDDDD